MDKEKREENKNLKNSSMPIFSRTPLFLGLRYLLKKKLSYLAIIGVMLSVGTLIVVMSVMVGFEDKLRSVVRGYLSDITVQPVNGGLTRFHNWRQASKEINSMDHIQETAPFIKGPGLIRIPDYDFMQHIMFRGVDTNLESEVTNFGGEFIKNADLSVLNKKFRGENNAKVPACIVGSEMAKQWSVHYQLYQKLSQQLSGELKDEVLDIFSDVRRSETRNEGRKLMKKVENKLRSAGKSNMAQIVAVNSERALRDEVILVTATEDLRRRLKKFVVAGVFNTGRYDYDSKVVLLSLDSAMNFIGSNGGITGINIKLTNYKFAPTVKDKLNKHYMARTWEDQQHNFLEAVEMEQTLMAIILSFVGMLAGFCIFAILIMTVYEKRRDIGILKALGFTPSDIAAIFLLNGTLIGIIGSILGAAAGLYFAYNINEIAEVVKNLTGWTPFPQDVYYFSKIPAYHGLLIPVLIASGAVICSLLFSVLPAIKAARMDAVETLRFE